MNQGVIGKNQPSFGISGRSRRPEPKILEESQKNEEPIFMREGNDVKIIAPSALLGTGGDIVFIAGQGGRRDGEIIFKVGGETVLIIDQQGNLITDADIKQKISYGEIVATDINQITDEIVDQTEPKDEDQAVLKDEDQAVLKDEDQAVLKDEDQTVPKDEDQTVPKDEDQAVPKDEDQTEPKDEDQTEPKDEDQTEPEDKDQTEETNNVCDNVEEIQSPVINTNVGILHVYAMQKSFSGTIINNRVKHNSVIFLTPIANSNTIITLNDVRDGEFDYTINCSADTTTDVGLQFMIINQ